jgi:anti-sigma factor ChrR (cupin superfamily)
MARMPDSIQQSQRHLPARLDGAHDDPLLYYRGGVQTYRWPDDDKRRMAPSRKDVCVNIQRKNHADLNATHYCGNEALQT